MQVIGSTPQKHRKCSVRQNNTVRQETIMTRLVLPHERRSNRSNGFFWCMASTSLPSIVIAIVWRPSGTDLIGLFLGAVIAGGFISWTAGNVLSAVYTSKQGIYRRDESPIRYWIHTIIIAVATALLIFYWLYQISAIAGAQSKIQSANTSWVATADKLPRSLRSVSPTPPCHHI
jgi:hypothetical protein